MADHRRYSLESNSEWDDPDSSSPTWAAPEYAFATESEDRSYSRRRSIECAAVRVEIVDTEINQDHTDYLIKATCGARTWIIKRRYKDFDYLDKQLKKFQPADLFPPLPPKRYLRSSNDPTIVDKRKEQLNSYLSTIVGIQSIWNTNDLVLFLNDDSNIMMFIWNVDRMRRLKDTLRLANAQQQSETERLNNDLEDAQRQVQALQEKLSQMEMIFLQQATGVATHQLPTSVMRSLNRADNMNPLSMQLAGEITKEHAALYYSEDSHADQEIIGPSATGAGSDETATASDDNDEEPMQPEDVLKAVNLAHCKEDVASYMRSNKPTTADEARTLSVSFELQEAIRMSHELFVDSSPPSKAGDAAAGARSMSKEGGDHRFKGLVNKDNEAIRSLQQGMTLPWINALYTACDPIINALIPTAASLDQRLKIFKFVRDLISRTSGIQLFPTGSFVTHTYLPDGDIDGTVFIPKMLDDSWYVKVNEALCLSAFNPVPSEEDCFTVSNVSFLNADIKMIRSLINNLSFDVMTNQAVSLQLEGLIERVDAFIGSNHLFKRSLLLIKAWMTWEFEKYIDANANLSSGKEMKRLLSTQALILLLIFTFNTKGETISHPLQALVHVIDVFLKFDWANMIMTIRGPISRDDLDPTNMMSAVGMMVSTGYIPEDVLDMSIKDEIKIEKPVKTTPFAAQAPSDAPAAAAAEVAAVTSSEQAAATTEVPLSISPMNADGSVAASNINSPKGGYHHHHHHRRVFNLSILNLVDPFQVDHNVFESIDAADCDLIVSVFLEAYKHEQVICQTMVKTEQSLENEATKVMKLLFPNTIARYGTVSSTVAAVHDSSGDVLLAAKQDMQFAWCYGSIAMNGKIDLATLIQVVLIVLDKKGPMPVGEVGKNLALIFGCDNLSRRLKEQFTGLKRAIENANSTTRLKVGTEHQFNPVVSLIGEGSVLPDIADSLWCFHHAAFLFTPFSINLQMQQQALKDSQARAAQQMMQVPSYPQSGYNNNAVRFNNNNSYARRPYTYGGNNHVNMTSDTMSVSSISTTNTDRRGPYGGGGEGYGHHMAYSPGGRGGYGGQMRSPTRPMANNNNMQQMMPPPMLIMQMPYDPATGQPFYPPPPPAMFAPAVPPMGAMYQQHPMAMPPYHGYYHNSMASSLGSSYGGPGMMGGNGSPISQSPSANSYMQPPPPLVLMQMMPPLLPTNNNSQQHQQQQQPLYPPQDEGN